MNMNFVKIILIGLIVLAVMPSADAKELKDNSMTGEVVFNDRFITITRHENAEAICYVYKGVTDISARFQCQFK